MFTPNPILDDTQSDCKAFTPGVDSVLFTSVCLSTVLALEIRNGVYSVQTSSLNNILCRRHVPGYWDTVKEVPSYDIFTYISQYLIGLNYLITFHFNLLFSICYSTMFDVFLLVLSLKSFFVVKWPFSEYYAELAQCKNQANRMLNRASVCFCFLE